MEALRSRRVVGRPDATSHAAIEQAAFRLFAERGFDGTTLDVIAQEVGVGRRTLFRYYASKNDIPWGQFDRTLTDFRAVLARTPRSLPLLEGVRRGIVAFNDFPDGTPSHRERMGLILETPALQAHSVLRYRQWRRVVAEFVAGRRGCSPDDTAPRLVGHVALALALSAYEEWLEEQGAGLAELIERHCRALEDFVADVAEGASGH